MGVCSMKKKMRIWHSLYYILTFLIYIAFFYSSSLMLEMSGKSENLGTVMAVTNGVLFVGTPIIIAVLMRFSLLKWYIDPFAAAEIPLFLYCGMVINQMKYTEDLSAAFLKINTKLCNDGGEGWIFLVGLFVFGLAASFSFARKKGQSISYKLISKISS